MITFLTALYHLGKITEIIQKCKRYLKKIQLLNVFIFQFKHHKTNIEICTFVAAAFFLLL